MAHKRIAIFVKVIQGIKALFDDFMLELAS